MLRPDHPLREKLLRGYYYVTATDMNGCQELLEIYVPGALDVPKDVSSDTEIIIAPNPSDGDFTVGLPVADALKDAEIVILNALGQRVLQQVVDAETTMDFSLKGPPGLYFVCLLVESSPVAVERVVKGQ